MAVYDGQRPARSAADAAIFQADPELGRDLAQVDWAATPLGPPAGGRRACRPP